MKQRIIDRILSVEGGYVDDPSDSGGETNFGITVVVARAYGYEGAMVDLPRYMAFEILARRYWDAVKGDQLFKLSETLAEEVVDTGVNMGVKRAGLFLQRSLNVLNDRARLYKDLKVDGILGPATISALTQYLLLRDEKALVKMLNCLQGSFYVELAERREKDERFVYGWFKNRVEI
jgi:lysozyme family protein